MSDALADRGGEPIAIRVRQAAVLLGIGRSTLYLYIASGELEVIKVCSATLMPMASLKAFVEARKVQPSEQRQ